MKIGDFDIGQQTRTVSKLEDNRIVFTKRRVASRGDEKAGLTKDEIDDIKDDWEDANIPDWVYRKVPGRNPLFMVHFLDVAKEIDGEVVASKSEVPAFGISFPGDPGKSRRPKYLVTYRVTTKWWNDHFSDDLDDHLGDME